MEKKKEKKLWTLMYYFAGDNALAPGMLSQLKAIKDAGFHDEANVIVRYDPNERGALTMTFDVNRTRKSRALKRRNLARDARRGPVVKIGDGGDSFVRNLADDVISDTVEKCQRSATWPPENATAVKGEPLSQAAQDLRDFLKSCREHHPAKHYVLFLVGHGMIVGNDAFLPDERPNSAITLRELGLVLKDFAGLVTEEATDEGTGEVTKVSAFDLVGMHSCSMSGVEVAYELKDTARYMMATEGVSFIGSWPYRQLLKKFFSELRKNGEALTIEGLLPNLFSLSRHNSTDFMFGGFSADLAVCNLDRPVVEGLTPKLRDLTAVLKEGLKCRGGEPDERVRELILLSHWKAQSYYQENYTDLYDFCFCLFTACDPGDDLQKRIRAACLGVMQTIDPAGVAALRKARRSNGTKSVAAGGPPDGAEAPGEKGKCDRLVVHSDTFGPAYQYSHGLSIYFPWSQPVDDAEEVKPAGSREKTGILIRYNEYTFTKDFKDDSKRIDDSWLSFLELYFEKTMRAPRLREDRRVKSDSELEPILKTVGAAASSAAVGALAGGSKTNPSESGGDGCSCPSIKNYPMRFLRRKKRPREAARRAASGD